MAFITLVPPVFVNVLNFSGVDATGATASDTGITAALNTIPTSTGGVLYFPPGTYLIQNGIDISAYSGNLWILGAGWSSTLKLANGANTYLIKSTTGSQQGVRISNLRLLCNSGNQTAASGGIYGYKWRRCLIEFVYIYYPWQAGILLTGDANDFGYQNHISHCFIQGGMSTPGGTNSYGNGIRLINTDENTISGNHFQDNGNPNDATYGFHVYDQNGLSSWIGNSFVNGMGVFKLDGLQSRIIGNIFDGNGGPAVQVNSAATNTIIKGNTCINPGYRASGGTANGTNAIYLNGAGAIVEGNYFQADASATPKTGAFLNVDTGAADAQIENNVFTVPTGAGSVVPITYVSGRPTRCRVRNNTGYNVVSNAPSWVTDSYGSATIPSGSTSVTVTHNLSETPSLPQISVTPQTSLGSAAFYWVSGVTSTSFTINVNTNPGADVTFSWRADVGY